MNDERQNEKEIEKTSDVAQEDYTDINVVTQKYADRFGNSPSWDSKESMIVAIKIARDEMKNERDKLNGIVKNHVERRKNIQAQIRRLMDEIDQLNKRRDELNKSVKEMKNERKEATILMKEKREIFLREVKRKGTEEPSAEKISRKELNEYEKSQEELHIFVTKIAAEAQEAHNEGVKKRKEVAELRNDHQNEHRNVEKYRELANTFHDDFIFFHLWLKPIEKVEKTQSFFENFERLNNKSIASKDVKGIDSRIKEAKKRYSDEIYEEKIHDAELKRDELIKLLKDEKRLGIEKIRLTDNELNNTLRNKIETISEEYYESQCLIREDLIINSIEFKWVGIELIIKVRGDNTTAGKCIGKNGFFVKKLYELIGEEIGKIPIINIQGIEDENDEES